MFLDDALGILLSDVAVPRPFRIHHTDRSFVADPKALALRSVTGPVRSGDVERFHSRFDVIPDLLASFRINAVGSDANEEMASEAANAEASRRILRRLILSLGHHAMISQRGTCFARSNGYSKGAFMANRDRDRTSQSDRNPMSDDDMVRSRADEADDVSNDSDEFEDTEDLDEDDDQDEGSF